MEITGYTLCYAIFIIMILAFMRGRKMSHITRRKFLKKSAGVIAAVIAGPAVLSAIPEKVEAKEITAHGSFPSEVGPHHLDQWGNLVGLSRHPLESDDKFRIRVMNKIRMK